MKITLNQVSALQKIRVGDAISTSERSSHTVLQGQRLSYQVVIGTKGIREKTRRILTGNCSKSRRPSTGASPFGLGTVPLTTERSFLRWIYLRKWALAVFTCT